MKILKRLNLLDYVIIIAFVFIVFAVIYSFIPDGKKEVYNIEILPKGEIQIKAGDICTDAESGKRLGEIEEISEGGSFVVRLIGEKTEHGIKVKGRNYLKNMTVLLYVGDFYTVGTIKDIRHDS